MNRDGNKDWLRKQHVVKTRNNNDNIASSFCNHPVLFDNVLKYFVGEPFLVMRNWLKLQPLGKTLTAYAGCVSLRRVHVCDVQCRVPLPRLPLKILQRN